MNIASEGTVMSTQRTLKSVLDQRIKRTDIKHLCIFIIIIAAKNVQTRRNEMTYKNKRVKTETYSQYTQNKLIHAHSACKERTTLMCRQNESVLGATLFLLSLSFEIWVRSQAVSRRRVPSSILWSCSLIERVRRRLSPKSKRFLSSCVCSVNIPKGSTFVSKITSYIHFTTITYDSFQPYISKTINKITTSLSRGHEPPKVENNMLYYDNI